jgi:dihydrofolate reductase
MRELIYSMGVSLDGYIARVGGNIDWTAPDDELHRFHNQQARETAVQLYGRRLYETMRFWETAHGRPEVSETELEFAAVWRETPKIVFSRTLEAVEGPSTRLATTSPAEEVAQLKASTDGGDVAVGGAGLAASVIDLIDEFRLFVNPVAIGRGTPFFPVRDERIGLDLVETRTFAGRVVYLRYRRT